MALMTILIDTGGGGDGGAIYFSISMWRKSEPIAKGRLLIWKH